MKSVYIFKHFIYYNNNQNQLSIEMNDNNFTNENYTKSNQNEELIFEYFSIYNERINHK